MVPVFNQYLWPQASRILNQHSVSLKIKSIYYTHLHPERQREAHILEGINAAVVIVACVGNTLGETQGRTEGRSWARKATLNYVGRNWDAREGKFEIWIEGYKERDPSWNKRRIETLEP